jgi:hypothetical protein
MTQLKKVDEESDAKEEYIKNLEMELEETKKILSESMDQLVSAIELIEK